MPCSDQRMQINGRLAQILDWLLRHEFDLRSHIEVIREWLAARETVRRLWALEEANLAVYVRQVLTSRTRVMPKNVSMGAYGIERAPVAPATCFDQRHFFDAPVRQERSVGRRRCSEARQRNRPHSVTSLDVSRRRMVAEDRDYGSGWPSRQSRSLSSSA